VAEGGGLLNRCRVKSSTGGSNPPLSAIQSTSPIHSTRNNLNSAINVDNLLIFATPGESLSRTFSRQSVLLGGDSLFREIRSIQALFPGRTWTNPISLRERYADLLGQGRLSLGHSHSKAARTWGPPGGWTLKFLQSARRDGQPRGCAILT
jgi:hypothetical protein